MVGNTELVLLRDEVLSFELFLAVRTKCCFFVKPADGGDESYELNFGPSYRVL